MITYERVDAAIDGAKTPGEAAERLAVLAGQLTRELATAQVSRAAFDCLCDQAAEVRRTLGPDVQTHADTIQAILFLQTKPTP